MRRNRVCIGTGWSCDSLAWFKRRSHFLLVLCTPCSSQEPLFPLPSSELPDKMSIGSRTLGVCAFHAYAAQVYVYPRHPTNEPFFPNLISEKNRRFVVLPTISLGGGREEKRDVLITGPTLIFVPSLLLWEVKCRDKKKEGAHPLPVFSFSFLVRLGVIFCFLMLTFLQGKCPVWDKEIGFWWQLPFLGGSFSFFMRQRLLNW